MTTNDVYWAAALDGLLPPTPDDSTKDSTQGFDRFAYPHDFQSPDKTLGQPHGQIPHNQQQQRQQNAPADTCCPSANNMAPYYQTQDTYQTFGSYYPDAYPQDNNEQLDNPTTDQPDLSASYGQHQHQQQLDVATPLHPLSFDEIMAAFAQAAGDQAGGGETSNEDWTGVVGLGNAGTEMHEFLGQQHQHQQPQQPYSLDPSSSLSVDQLQGVPPAYGQPWLQLYAPAPSSSHPSLSPASEPSPPHSLASEAVPFHLPYNATHFLTPSTAPPPPPPLSTLQFQQPPPTVSQAGAYGAHGSQRGGRTRRNPDHSTGGLDVAASMSLMGVTERDEDGDVEMNGWEDLEFGVHTKPPFAPMVDRVLENGKRFELGERSIIVMTPKVAQKSYGNEKRFLCPPPSAILVGKGWFDPLIPAPDNSDPANPLSPTQFFPPELNGATFAATPPSVNISISHELSPPEHSTVVQWMSGSGVPMRFAGQAVEEGPKKKSKAKAKASSSAPVPTEIPTEVASYGTAVNRSVYVTEGVSEADQATASKDLHTGLHTSGKLSGATKRVVKASIKVYSPLLPGQIAGQEQGLEIGAFESREIKVISKPARKKVSGSNTASAAKGVDLSINHGTLISAFQRLKSQAAATKFLSIFDAASYVRSSDGEPLVSPDQRTARSSSGRVRPATFEASSTKWDSFIIWKVDIKTRNAKPQQYNHVPPEPDWPTPPALALPYSSATPSPIHFNHTVMLQCPKTGFISPVLVVRRVDDNGRALGGHLTHVAEDDPCVPAGEGVGEAISQLQKIAFEVYHHSYIPVPPDSAGKTGDFLSIVDDAIRTECPPEGRQLFPSGDSVMATGPPAPPEPEPTPAPPQPVEADESNDGGKVLKRRTSASKVRSSSVGSGNRSRRNSASSDKAPAKLKPMEAPMVDNPPRWWIEIKDNAIWTIIGVESVRYNFSIPRVKEVQPESLNGPSIHLGAIAYPVTPLPALLRYLQPKPLGQNEESINLRGYDTKFLSRTSREMITLYGTAFKKDPNKSDSSWELFFGHRRAPHVELRCQEVMAAVLPATVLTSRVDGTGPPDNDSSAKRNRVLSLVRKSDGVLIPSSLEYS